MSNGHFLGMRHTREDKWISAPAYQVPYCNERSAKPNTLSLHINTGIYKKLLQKSIHGVRGSQVTAAVLPATSCCTEPAFPGTWGRTFFPLCPKDRISSMAKWCDLFKGSWFPIPLPLLSLPPAAQMCIHMLQLWLPLPVTDSTCVLSQNPTLPHSWHPYLILNSEKKKQLPPYPQGSSHFPLGQIKYPHSCYYSHLQNK